MKKYLLLVAIAIFSVNLGSCSSGNAKGGENKSSEVNAVAEQTIQILYFHGDRRCPTCIKVGEISLKLFNTKYANNSSVIYKEVNTDKEENKVIAEKYQITSSTLLIDVKGVIRNITVDAFKLANSDPAALEKMITDIIEAGLAK